MKIIVINGSPSGLKGVTALHVQYLAQQLPEHQFEVIEAARKIRQIERDASCFAAIVEQMSEADAILWAFPVYVMLVPAQLKRFIELLFERARWALAGKVTTCLSTSAHHYDHTTHDYMQGVCSDLGMTCVRGFSAGQQDLLTEQGRRDLLGFAAEFLLHASGETPVDAPVPPVEWRAPEGQSPLPAAVPKRPGRRIVVISDADPADHSLRRMIELFDRSVSIPVDRLELSELRVAGGCLGCMQCADDGRCRYRDEYAAAFDERVRTADVVI